MTVGLLGPYKQSTNYIEVVKIITKLGGSRIDEKIETQEMLIFCAAHQISTEVHLIDFIAINEAFEKVKDEKVRFSYVINIATLH